jgi:hypothetical protein
MLSATYQLSSSDDLALRQSFAAFARRRLDAEEIRDSLLFVGGNLDETPGGPHPFPPEDKWGFTQHAPFRAEYEHNRRSIYLMTQRIQMRPFMALFDGPDPSSSTGQRLVSTVPTQALYFLNNELLHQQAAALAQRVANETKDESERVKRAHWLALGRDATADEIADAVAFLERYERVADRQRAWAAWCRVLLGSNEFLYVD